jgi:hypothetical protein|tara:strand:- start:238 stop:519 length:282 start_codon:yes stop_codon:yes gene_type:complete
MNASNFWTQKTTNEQTFNVSSEDGFSSISISVSGTGSDTTDIIGTLKLDGTSSTNIQVAIGDSLTISADNGKVLDGIIVVTASDNTTLLIGVQ